MNFLMRNKQKISCNPFFGGKDKIQLNGILSKEIDKSASAVKWQRSSSTT